MKSVRSVSFGVVCCCGSCLTIFVFGTATVVAVGGFVAMVEVVFTVSTFEFFQLSIFANEAKKVL